MIDIISEQVPNGETQRSRTQWTGMTTKYFTIVTYAPSHLALSEPGVRKLYRAVIGLVRAGHTPGASVSS